MDTVPNFSDNLSKATLFRVAGCYKEGLSVLAKLQCLPLSQQQRRYIALEKAENYFTRGYVKRAEIILNKAVKVSSANLTLEGDDTKIETHALLLIRKAFAAVFRNGKVEDALRTQAYIRNTYLSEDFQSDLVNVMVNSLFSADWMCRSTWKLPVLRFFY